MRKKIFYFLTGIGLAGLPVFGQSSTSASVATIPEGFVSFNLPATGGSGTTTYLSIPLSNNPFYSGAVASVTDSSITVADVPAPWSTGALSGTTPYFVKFLTGSEAGRVIMVTANTTNSLTLDTTDNSPQTVALTTSGFSVQPGDTFEVFVGATVSSVFGSNTANSPLVLQGGTSAYAADTVGVYSQAMARWMVYYYNSGTGYWMLNGSTANANNTVLYPYSAITIMRPANEAATDLVLTGRVAEVSMLTKTTGSDVNVYTSTKYPTDMTLSQLQFGSNWTQSDSAFTADTLSVWDAPLSRFDTFYQLPDSTWRKYGAATTDVSSLVVPAGSILSVLKRSAVEGATSFLQTALPYSVN
jgi:uncharacterized protein (TIGR02597 family)